MAAEEPPLTQWLERLAEIVTRWLGSNGGFATAFVVVLAWAACGPVFDYSPTWQLVINTGTTIVTFLVVFLLQRSQNKESRAVQLKLDELVAAMAGASNRLIAAEQLSEAELDRLSAAYQALARRAAARGKASTESCSVDRAAATPAPAARARKPAARARRSR